MASMIWYDTDKKEIIYIDNLLTYNLWNKFSNNFDAQSDFGGKNVKKKWFLGIILILSML